MFEWLRAIGGDAANLQPILENFKQMMIDGLHMFDLAANALLGGTNTEVIRKELFKADKGINKNEQSLRRQLIVHASVHGASGFPTCLVLMSIAKDAERIGDYCKNLFDLAASGRISEGLAEFQDLVKAKDELSNQLRRMIRVFDSQDQDEARQLMHDAEALQDFCDENIEQLIAGEFGGREPVISALAFRYFKRICAHSKNITTSIVLPVDLLDYDDED